MKGEPLVDAAGLVADGAAFDLMSISSGLSSDEERAVADELAVIARIAEAHRKLHQVLPGAPQPPHDEPYLFAARWGHLELIEIVGRGSYGTVYRAWDPRLDRLVALKLFHGARNPEAVMREGRMLARIRHENVVTVYGADVYDGIAGIWMEFVHGQRLDQIIEKTGRLSAHDATLVGLAVCRSLVAVHEAGLLHCDVKAQNVIREQGGRIVLMDLGAGRSTIDEDDSTAGIQVAGTPRYMAPEVFDRGPALPQSDVYSVGVLLFHMVTGKFPVDGRSLAEIRAAHLQRKQLRLVEVCPDLPADFVKAVTRALDPSPEARHKTPADLERALMGVPTAEVPASTPSTRKQSAIGWIAGAALVVAVAAGVVWRIVKPVVSPVVPATRTIAVMPIRNLTGDPSKAYLADGLTEVLISNLARVRSIRVPSSAAVAEFRGRDEPSATIASKLGADLLLAGSVLEFGERVRITVHLIDPASDAVVWSQLLSRDPSETMSAQAEVARLVAAHLKVKLSDSEDRALRQAALNPRAQDAYLRARAAYEDVPDLRTAQAVIADLKTATQLEPAFAEAWAHHALALLRLIELDATGDRRQGAAEVKALAQHALDLDPTSPEGYLALGTVQFFDDWDFEAAEQTLRSALEFDPSSGLALQRLANLLASRRRLDEAIQLGRQAVALERLQASRHAAFAILHYYSRDFTQAEAEFKRALDLSPKLPAGHFGLGRVYSAQGRQIEAIAEIEKAIAVVRRPSYLVELARVLTTTGDEARGRTIMAELDARRGQGEGLSLDNYAYLAVERGEIDDAFSILEQAIKQRLTNVLWLAVDPRVDRLRTDPRFNRLLTGIGLQP